MVPTVTWIGHATVLVQIGGLNVLTDPIFSNARLAAVVHRPARARRSRGCGHTSCHTSTLVLISHNHYDHLDDDSVEALAAPEPAGRRCSWCRWV